RFPKPSPIVADGDQELAIGTKGQPLGTFRAGAMLQRQTERLADCCVPKACGIVLACRGRDPAIRAESHGINGARVLEGVANRLAGAGVPEARRVVVAA